MDEDQIYIIKQLDIQKHDFIPSPETMEEKHEDPLEAEALGNSERILTKMKLFDKNMKSVLDGNSKPYHFLMCVEMKKQKGSGGKNV